MNPMSKQFVSPDEKKDLRIFQARVMSLLGDISSEIQALREDIAKSFHVPSHDSSSDVYPEVSSGSDDYFYDDEDNGASGDDE